jgi:hypothetical protein
LYSDAPSIHSNRPGNGSSSSSSVGRLHDEQHSGGNGITDTAPPMQRHHSDGWLRTGASDSGGNDFSSYSLLSVDIAQCVLDISFEEPEVEQAPDRDLDDGSGYEPVSMAVAMLKR